MRPGLKIAVYTVLGLLAIGILDYSFAWFGVFKTRTVEVEQENAEREKFEETQSYVHAKRQEALNLYQDYQMAKTNDEKQIIRNVVSHSFAAFDDDKLEGEVKDFVMDCKYNVYQSGPTNPYDSL